MQNTHVFIINTIYQGLLSSYFINTIDSKDRVVVFDATVGLEFYERQCFPENVVVLKLFDDAKVQSGFFSQLVHARKISRYKVSGLGKIDFLYTYNDVSPVEAYIAKEVKSAGGAVYFVEEGLSAYRVIPRFSKEKFNGIVKAILSGALGLSYRINFGHSIYLDVLYLRSPDNFRRLFPFIKTDLRKIDFQLNSKEINKNFIDSFISDDHWVFDVKSPIMFYLGQPLSEAGYFSRDFEIKVVKQLQEICQANNVLFCIKTHPSEDASKYDGFDYVIHSKAPVELILNMLEKKRTILISPFSSVNSNLIEEGFFRNSHAYKLFNINIDFKFPGVPNIKDYKELKQSVSCLASGED